VFTQASTLEDRVKGGLLGQDLLIRDHIAANDVLIVSIGGNDVALRPSLKTIMSVSWLTFFSRDSNLENGTAYGDHDHSVISIHIYHCLQLLGMGHVRHVFHDQLKGYISEICANTKPKLVLVTMIYYPSESGQGWADPLLKTLGYNKDPSTLQKIIRTVFRECVSEIK
jgi:lysophospholipase L1-like esterase